MHIPALLQFLQGLAENNNRPWFVHNKPAYDILREEFAELVSDLIQRVSKFDKNIGHIDPKKSLFRIYRDVRFSKNKDPYKTHFSAVLGDKKTGAPCYYFQIDGLGKLGLGGGIYMPEPATLKNIRNAIVTDSAGFSKVLKHKRFAAAYGGLIDEDRLQRPPKGYDANHPHIEQIKNKHFFGWKEIDIRKRKHPDLAGEIAAAFEDAYPLVTWLRGAVK
jgi:uncharacterized protein (TIGR02453 family)